MSDEQLEQVLDPAFVEGLDSLPTDEVRRRRAVAEAEEEAISYVRRVLQGRLDILRAEVRRRSEAGSAEAQSLLGQLAQLLTDDRPTERDVLGSRATRLRVPQGVEPHERRLEAVLAGSELDDLEHLPVETLEDYASRLSDHEHELSATRRQLFARIDALRSELAARYKDGRAAVSDLLSEPR
jgi:hypothetical protein